MKIKKDELKELQDRVSNINQAKLRLGTLETQKMVIAQAIVNLQRQLEEFHKKLDVLYGNGDKISVDVTTGQYKKLENDEADKKN
jgi:hypothetical protein|tara:strand:+ start:25 stop:279 length:255 start_codon:yes stop_codon:yes gene_type:complete